VNDSFRYLKAFDLYVLPSHLECFSLSLLDAQLADLPVIGSDSGGTPEVVIPDQTGWLFKPRSISSLREKLKEALVQTDRWAQYGEKARMRVEKEFEQTEIFGKILKNYGMDK
jgi:glycosyltransferase involved in cell wall biosynthesis